MRIALLYRLIFLGMLLVWLGLVKTQILEGPRHREQSEKNRSRLIHLPAARGAILDRRGVPLAQDRLSFELSVLPQELSDPERTWSRLAGIVGVESAELARRYRRRFQARFAPVPLVEDLTAETAFRLEEERQALSGILVQPVPRRRYPLGSASGAVIGYLGLINPEELTRLKPYGYTFRDRVGKDGLEKQNDPYLRGQDGGLHLEVDATGRMVQQIGHRRPQRGRAITVSLDGRLQEISHRLMQGVEGALIVMDSASGEILAMVSSPGFDPALFLDSEQRERVARLLRDPDRPLFNRAIRARVPPGSTFKAAVAYKALEEGRIHPGTAQECVGQYRLGRSVFRCWQEAGHGPQTVQEALEHSCNVFFYQAGRRLGPEGIQRAGRLFGLDRPTGIDLPWEAKGLVPGPGWMQEVYHQPWQEGDTISYAIGQGPLQVTPIEMLLFFNAIATGGRFPQPRLLLKVEGEEAVEKPRAAEVHLDEHWLAEVRQGLERVVHSDTGTGRLARVEGVRLAGKTGTAEVPRGAPHAWFCGYAPAKSPKVSFVVFLEHGGKGGVRAAQVAGSLVGYLNEMDYL